MGVKLEQPQANMELTLSEKLLCAMDTFQDVDFGFGDDDMASFKLDNESMVDSGISTPVHMFSPGPLLDTSIFEDFAWDMLSPKSDALSKVDSCLDDMCAQLDLDGAGNFIGLHLDIESILELSGANPTARGHLETPLDAIGAINPQALQTADDEDEEIDVVGLGEEMSTVPHSMDSHQPQSFAIAQPVIFTADSTTQLSMPSVIPGVASIVLPPLSAFSQINTSTPTSSRSTSPTNIKSSRVQPYPTPPHTPKRNTERKRQLHNELERKRREDLNSVFNMLGDVIPSLSVGSKGAPTQTQILQGATSLLKSLKSESTQLATQKDALLSEQSRLKARLAQLASR